MAAAVRAGSVPTTMSARTRASVLVSRNATGETVEMTTAAVSAESAPSRTCAKTASASASPRAKERSAVPMGAVAPVGSARPLKSASRTPARSHAPRVHNWKAVPGTSTRRTITPTISARPPLPGAMPKTSVLARAPTLPVLTTLTRMPTSPHCSPLDRLSGLGFRRTGAIGANGSGRVPVSLISRHGAPISPMMEASSHPKTAPNSLVGPCGTTPNATTSHPSFVNSPREPGTSPKGAPQPLL